MERKRIICLFLFVVLILIFSSCHPRRVSDVKLAMTKEEVVSLWGQTNLITYKTVNGTTLETWEYHFASSGSICQITFVQDRVTGTECRQRPRPEPYYYTYRYYPYSYSYPYPYYYPYYYPFYYPHRRHYYYPHGRHRR